jgi:hypothetical protein
MTVIAAFYNSEQVVVLRTDIGKRRYLWIGIELDLIPFFFSKLPQTSPYRQGWAAF